MTTDSQYFQPAPPNGGPAFPLSNSHPDLSRTNWAGSNGMTLRDYFAAKAMHAEIMTCGVPGDACDAMLQAMEPDETVEEHIARTAYRMADAMLKVRGEAA